MCSGSWSVWDWVGWRDWWGQTSHGCVPKYAREQANHPRPPNAPNDMIHELFNFGQVLFHPLLVHPSLSHSLIELTFTPLVESNFSAIGGGGNANNGAPSRVPQPQVNERFGNLKVRKVKQYSLYSMFFMSFHWLGEKYLGLDTPDTG